MPFSQDNALALMLNTLQQFDYPVHSRIHPLKTFPNCYVKREDELGLGISGSKIRKYRSLIPYFLKNKMLEVVVIGGANSNHVLGISQLLIENGIKPILFLRGEKHQKNELGNQFFLQLFIDLDEVHFVSRQNWQNVSSIASTQYPEHFILEEGGMTIEALPGLLSLSLDIKRNEEAHDLNFDHVFIDAGTGFTAIALLLGFSFLRKKTKVHVLLLADSKQIFLEKLKIWHQNFEKIMNCSCPFPTDFFLHEPNTAKSFGSTNKKVFDEIKTVARKEGFLTDPIYSSKLFLESRRIIQEEALCGQSLIIHSGGALTLTGFHNKLLQK